MRIRLHGTHAENGAALQALDPVLNFHTVSRPYRNYPPSTSERIYLAATIVITQRGQQ